MALIYKTIKCVKFLTYISDGMVVKSHGPRRSTRRKFRKKIREKFKPSPYLQEFKTGSRVAIEQNSSSHKGMPHPRFKGKVGVIKGKRGNAYLVEIKDGNKTKIIISNPEHLKLVS